MVDGSHESEIIFGFYGFSHIYLVDDCFTEHKIVPRYYIMIGFMAGEVPIFHIVPMFVHNLHRIHNKHLADYLRLKINEIYYVEVPSIQKTKL